MCLSSVSPAARCLVCVSVFGIEIKQFKDAAIFADRGHGFLYQFVIIVLDLLRLVYKKYHNLNCNINVVKIS
jgi:hypothetical protein